MKIEKNILIGNEHPSFPTVQKKPFFAGLISVMIVDDEPEIGTGIRDSVDWGILGMKVVSICTNGTEAITNAINLKPDIIITDIKMPDFSGLDMADRLRLQGCNSRFIFISAYSDVDFFKRAFKVNAVDYILKPVNMKELTAVLRSLGNDIRIKLGAMPLPEPPDSTTEYSVSSVIRKVYSYTEENLGSRLTISGLSKVCNLSPNYLSYLFRREVGITINEYITARRMQKACELLKQDGKIYISDVAAQVGYRDAAYFSRQFRMSIGQTPQEYQEGGKS